MQIIQISVVLFFTMFNPGNAGGTLLINIHGYDRYGSEHADKFFLAVRLFPIAKDMQEDL